jgi:uncharacterized protein YaaR (DUF327 family)
LKISELNAARGTILNGPGPEVKQTPHQKITFGEVMNGLDRQNCNQKLAELSEEILAQGRVLSERYDIAELKRYKRMLAEFMREAVRFSYEFKKNSARDRHGRHKIYAVIKKINKKLEELTENILGQQVDTIQLIADIDEVNGMLVDLLA